MEKPLFTVVITSYKQERTIRESIDSVLAQTYPNFELIITDDGSLGFDAGVIQNYIDKNRSVNLKHSVIYAHPRNMGTTKSINSAVTKASGRYMTLFAADDCLYDENTLSNYEQAFRENPSIRIITAQCHRYDLELKEFLSKQVNVETAQRMNDSLPKIQYKKISEVNIFAMGATAFQKETLEKHRYFDERYKLVEDWPLFLKLTRNGEKIFFVDFIALKHREGGLSKRKDKENSLALNSKEFCVDLLRVFENEIFPYMHVFSHDEQNEKITRYIHLVTSNKSLLSDTIYKSRNRVRLRLLIKHPYVSLRLFLKNRGSKN